MNIIVNVVDGLHGRPAEGIAVSLDQQGEDGWKRVLRAVTDERGRAAESRDDPTAGRGIYLLELDADHYYATLGVVPAQVRVSVVLRIQNPVEDNHFSVLITPSAALIYRNMSDP